MSIAGILLKLLPTPDYERVRRELLIALASGEWINVLQVRITGNGESVLEQMGAATG